ncbi:hypothetical protein G6F57_020743 [Rhizopus arrhizus]|nr:hypothetical protein G6F57_020743 [Rhizopus arrhizus]
MRDIEALARRVSKAITALACSAACAASMPDRAQAALADVGDDVGRILVIGIAEQREQHALAFSLAVAQVLGDGGGVVQRSDLVQLRLQRRPAGGFDLRFVVAGLPDVTDLGFHRTGLGLAGGGLLYQRSGRPAPGWPSAACC